MSANPETLLRSATTATATSSNTTDGITHIGTAEPDVHVHRGSMAQQIRLGRVGGWMEDGWMDAGCMHVSTDDLSLVGPCMICLRSHVR